MITSMLYPKTRDVPETSRARSCWGLAELRSAANLMTSGLVLMSAASVEAAGRVPVSDAERATVIVVAGAAGEAEFAPDFRLQVEAWAKVSAQAEAKHVVIGVEPAEGPSDRDRVKAVLEAEAKATGGEVWLVLIGHGTFDGKDAKLNLRGPDVSSTDFAEWLKPFQRPLAVIDTTSSSAPFMARLSTPQRVVVTSTRSGYQQNYARFGKFLAEALSDTKSDLDKDGQISLLESFLTASHRTAEFYKTEGRLATEHALLDDNGDGLGTPADWFRGVNATKRAKDGAALDGVRAHQFHLVRSPEELLLKPDLRAKRDKLEQRVAELRQAKAKMPEGKYFAELEKLLLELAELYSST